MKSLKQFAKWYLNRCVKYHCFTPTGMIPFQNES